MTWAAPAYAWLLLLALPALLLLRWARSQRQAAWRQLSDAGEVPGGSAWRAWLPFVVFLLLVTALCRPQWGQVAMARQTLGRDLIIALDVSRSMLADDLAPNRLDNAKRAIAGLIPHLRGERIGLIAFAGSAFLVCPLTSDYATFAGALAEVGPDSIPLGGSVLTGALNEAGRAFGNSSIGKNSQAHGKVLIVISDGEDHGDANSNTNGESELTQAAQTLRATGVSLHSVAAGTRMGGLIPLPGGAFLKNRAGDIVTSRLQTAPLNAIAPEAQTWALSAGPQVLAKLYATHASTWEKHDSSATRPIPAERYQFPLTLALLLLLVEPWLNRRDKA